MCVCICVCVCVVGGGREVGSKVLITETNTKQCAR